MNIDRRHLLGSLAAATICAPAADSAAHAAALHCADRPHEGWFLAREARPQTRAPVIDFWQRPFSDIAYTQYLHDDIVRGAIWWDSRESPNHPTSEMMERSFQHQGYDWAGKPHRLAASLNGHAELLSALRPLIDDDADRMAPPTGRTALIALDSLGPLPEPSWADILPAFRSCYEHVIGHFHLPQRGLRQYRQWLKRHFGEDYFREYFVNAAAQCDAVILTSSALAEADIYTRPRASTEELTGKLMRHFSCALLTPEVLERIAGAGKDRTSHGPRFFALGGLTQDYIEEYYMHRRTTLCRQPELVQFSFGDMPDERPLFVATVMEEAHPDLLDEFRQELGEPIITAAVAARQIDWEPRTLCNLLQVVMLWPFEFDEDKLDRLDTV